MTEQTASPAPHPPPTAGHRPSTVPRRSWQALVVLLAGMFIALLDTTIVNVALPTIRTSLDASESTLSWIISGYALAFGLALIPAGRVGDRIGHKWVFFTGIALFTVASAACGLAQSDTQLVVFRVVQGLAGGIFVPAVTAFIQLLFPGRVRGQAFAIMGAVIGVSSALGPIVGGLIIQAFGETSGWRLVFGVNLPIGVATLVAAALLLPAKHETDRERPGRDRLARPAAAHRRPRRPAGPADRGPGQGLADLDVRHARRRRGAARGLRALGDRVHPTRREPAGAAAPVQPRLVHRRRRAGAGLLRRVHQHLLHPVDPLADRPRAQRPGVRRRVDPLRDRQHHRLVAEQQAGPAPRPHGARDRHRPGQRRAGLAVALAAQQRPAPP